MENPSVENTVATGKTRSRAWFFCRPSLLIWAIAIALLLGIARWAGSDVQSGRACLEALTVPFEKATVWGFAFHLKSLDLFPKGTQFFFLLPVLYLPFRRRRLRREAGVTWLLLCACAACYAAEASFLGRNLVLAGECAVASFGLSWLMGRVSRKEGPDDQQPSLGHHVLLALMIVSASLIYLWKIDRYRAAIFHGYAPWWTLKLTEGYLPPKFWEGIGFLQYCVGGSGSSYRSPLFIGLSLVMASITHSFLICSRVAATLFPLSVPLLLYGICRRLWSRNAGLFAAGVSLLWPLHLINGRADSYFVGVAPVMLLASYLLLVSGQTASMLLSLISGVVLSLCVYPGYLYSPSRLIPLACSGFWITGVWLSKARWWRRVLAGLLLLLTLSGMLLLNPLSPRDLLFQFMYGGDAAAPPVPDSISPKLRPYVKVFFMLWHKDLAKNLLGEAEMLFSTTEGPLHQLLVSPLVIPALGLLLGRGFFRFSFLFVPWLVIGILPGLVPGPTYPSRIAILDAIPMLGAGIVLGEVCRRLGGKRRDWLTASWLGPLVILLGLWSTGWYFQITRKSDEEHVDLLTRAAQVGFTRLGQDLVLIECPQVDEFERLSLNLTDQTGLRSSKANIRFLWYHPDRKRLQDIALATGLPDQGWVFVPQSWDKLSSAEVLRPVEVYSFLDEGRGGFGFMYLSERRLHPNVAFKDEPIIVYSDLNELLIDLQASGQSLYAILLNDPDRKKVLAEVGMSCEELPGGAYVEARFPAGVLKGTDSEPVPAQPTPVP